MRNIIFFSLLFLTLSSCSNFKLYHTFSEIDNLLDDCPDSALHSLSLIDTTLLKNVGERARYSLLKAKCLDKNFIDDGLMLDQLLKYEGYFRHHGSKVDKMLYNYYLADQLYDLEKYEEASVRFVDAFSYAVKSDDYFYCGQACWGLSLIYLKTYNYVEELKQIKLAYEYLRKGNFDYHANYAEVQLAEAYLKNADKNKAMDYYDDALFRAKESNDSLMVSYVLTSSALCLLTGNDPNPEEVISRMNEAESLGYDFSAINYGDMAMAYHLLDRDGDAFLCISKALQMSSDDQKSYLYVASTASRIYSDLNMFKDAFLIAETIRHYTDSVTIKILGQSVVNAQLQDHQEKEKAAEFRLMQSRITLIVSVMLLCALICISLLISKNKHDKMTFEYNKKIQQYSRSVNELKSMLNSLLIVEKGGEKEHNSLKFIFAAFDNLFDEYYHSPGRENTVLLGSFESMLKKFRCDFAFINEFESMVDTANNGIITIVSKECHLKDSDLYLYAFMVAETSYSTICVIFGVSLSVIYNRVKRLKMRIQESNPEHKEEIMRYLANRSTGKVRKTN